MTKSIHLHFAAAALAAFLVAGMAGIAAADEATLTLTLKNHKFDPLVPTVPAGVRVKITATNADDSPAEIESGDFKLEKVVPAGKTVVVTIGPLKPGTYKIYDEYHEDESTTDFIAK
ncbi:MAG TPA: cupredoxin domain-containing protein [Magnetospirillaceae bacterium]|jgi:hypothetical protein